MDEIDIPWRIDKKIDIITLNPSFNRTNLASSENKSLLESSKTLLKSPLSDEALLNELQIKGQIIAEVQKRY